MSFKEKVIVITGAGSGIGAATVRFFAKKEALWFWPISHWKKW